jgi:hypothetical protein
MAGFDKDYQNKSVTRPETGSNVPARLMGFVLVAYVGFVAAAFIAGLFVYEYESKASSASSTNSGPAVGIMQNTPHPAPTASTRSPNG